MPSPKRVRRAGLLCCHCVRNIAYYRAGWVNGSLVSPADFWKNTNSNFIDIAVLEWCKLFADPKGKHNWRKVVPDRDQFLENLYEVTGVTEGEFKAKRRETKKYRDKFVAHLDDDLRMYVPELDILLSSTQYLFDVIRMAFPDYLADAPEDLMGFYEESFVHGRTIYPLNA